MKHILVGEISVLYPNRMPLEKDWQIV